MTVVNLSDETDTRYTFKHDGSLLVQKEKLTGGEWKFVTDGTIDIDWLINETDTFYIMQTESDNILFSGTAAEADPNVTYIILCMSDKDLTQSADVSTLETVEDRTIEIPIISHGPYTCVVGSYYDSINNILYENAVAVKHSSGQKYSELYYSLENTRPPLTSAHGDDLHALLKQSNIYTLLPHVFAVSDPEITKLHTIQFQPTESGHDFILKYKFLPANKNVWVLGTTDAPVPHNYEYLFDRITAYRSKVDEYGLGDNQYVNVLDSELIKLESANNGGSEMYNVFKGILWNTAGTNLIDQIQTAINYAHGVKEAIDADEISKMNGVSVARTALDHYIENNLKPAFKLNVEPAVPGG